MKRMFEDKGSILRELLGNVTMTMDGLDETSGHIGFRGYAAYDFSWDDLDDIIAYIREHDAVYRRCYNTSDLVQSILTDLLNEGLVF